MKRIFKKIERLKERGFYDNARLIYFRYSNYLLKKYVTNKYKKSGTSLSDIQIINLVDWNNLDFTNKKDKINSQQHPKAIVTLINHIDKRKEARL